MTDLKQEALNLAKQCYAVFPLSPMSKIPLKGSNGFKDATTDPEQIRTWWSDHPDANIGIATGAPSHDLVVIDIDNKNGHDGFRSLEEWEKVHGDFPDTLQVRTPNNGIHLYFRDRGHWKSVTGILDGIDIRADNSCVTAPASMLENGEYILLKDCPQAPALINDSVRDLLNLQGSTNTDSDYHGSTFVDDGKPILQGSRNDMLSHIAGALVIKHPNWTIEQLEDEVRKINQERCDPPLPDDELSGSILKSMKKWKRKRDSEPPEGSLSRSNFTAEEWDRIENEQDDGNLFDDVSLETFDEINDTENLPEFDMDLLPSGTFRNYGRDICNSVQVSPDMVGLALLAIVSACIHHKFYVAVNADFIKPMNMYVTIIAKPSERKSSVREKIVSPVYEYAQEQNKDLDAKRKQQQWEKKDAEKELKRLEKQIDSEKGDTDGLKTRCEELKAKISDIDLHPIKRYRVIAGDNTAESIASIMYDNDESINIITDEGGLFDTMAGRYSSNGKTANIDIYLHSWSEDHTDIDRKTGDLHISMEHPSMSILMFVQPDVVKKVMENRDFSGRGLLARFCYAYTHECEKDIEKEIPIPKEDKEQYKDALYDLLKMPSDKPPVMLKFSEDAKPLIKQYSDEERALVKKYDNEDISTWYGKSFGLQVTISGLLHIMTYGSRSGDYVISKELLSDAHSIVGYLSCHAEYAFTSGGRARTVAEETAIYILEKMQRINDTSLYTAKDGRVYRSMRMQTVFQACKKRYDTRKKLQLGLNELKDRGYIRIIKEQSDHGRKPTEYIILNPDTEIGEMN